MNLGKIANWTTRLAEGEDPNREHHRDGGDDKLIPRRQPKVLLQAQGEGRPDGEEQDKSV